MGPDAIQGQGIMGVGGTTDVFVACLDCLVVGGYKGYGRWGPLRVRCLTCWRGGEGGEGWSGVEGGSVTAAQPLDHAMNAGYVVVGGAHKLEQALQRVLPEHSGTCAPHSNFGCTTKVLHLEGCGV